ncbi:hypothetical protein WA1_49270 [Scytonema hofmannii PCC 7110]|uniref:Uncharacterized protein n=1 Tax=Scytonema hofmannii PCC 7110 TaxID=128403 RepID=A0A139WQM0_9CYAN|nr:hypothetical protein [Scytonema hofmannii]KYC34732.1 hypothetical protein WA1_49270 [Scytonema hofmannii PCC 7110]
MIGFKCQTFGTDKSDKLLQLSSVDLRAKKDKNAEKSGIDSLAGIIAVCLGLRKRAPVLDSSSS